MNTTWPPESAINRGSAIASPKDSAIELTEDTSTPRYRPLAGKT
jgi:hypothetical protein